MENTKENLSRQLQALAELSAKTQREEQRIKGAARQRLNEIHQELEALKNKTWTDEKASETYQKLILERGRLHQVLSVNC